MAVLDADKEGFLRSSTALIQTIGRAARHVRGTALLFADRVTGSMKRAIDETDRRRAVQQAHNERYGYEPMPIVTNGEGSGAMLDLLEEAKARRQRTKQRAKQQSAAISRPAAAMDVWRMRRRRRRRSRRRQRRTRTRTISEGSLCRCPRCSTPRPHAPFPLGSYALRSSVEDRTERLRAKLRRSSMRRTSGCEGGMRAMAYFSEYSIVSGAQGSGGSDCGVRVETLILCEEDYATG